MMKKIMVVCGSPRTHGNTNTVVNWFVEAARGEGVEVDVIDAASLEYAENGCTECMACQQSDKYECVIDDEASPIIARMPQYDALIFATPVFWVGPSAQLKLLLDRTLALIKIDPQTGEAKSCVEGKMMGLISTAGGNVDEGLGLVEETFKTGAEFCRAKYASLLISHAPQDPTKMAGQAEIKERAIEFAKEVLRS